MADAREIGRARAVAEVWFTYLARPDGQEQLAAILAEQAQNPDWLLMAAAASALVGLLNGFGFAMIMGAIAAAWFGIADLGLVIGLAMVCVLVAAAFGGIAIPLLLTRLRVDPAIASGPFVTTVTDVVGFFAFLGIATLWFGLK